MTYEEDLKAKVHELFQQVADNLEPQLDKLIRSGCGVVDDHARCNGGYLAANAFIVAFLQNEKDRIEPARIIDRFDELLKNYEKFI